MCYVVGLVNLFLDGDCVVGDCIDFRCGGIVD